MRFLCRSAVCACMLVAAGWGLAQQTSAPALSPSAAKYGFLGVVAGGIDVDKGYVPKPLRYDSVVNTLEKASEQYGVTVYSKEIDGVLGTLLPMDDATGPIRAEIRSEDGRILAKSQGDKTPEGFNHWIHFYVSHGSEAHAVFPAGRYTAYVFWNQEKQPVLVLPFTVSDTPPAGTDSASKAAVLQALQDSAAKQDIKVLQPLVDKREASVPGLAAVLADPASKLKPAALVVLHTLGPYGAGAANEVTLLLKDSNRQMRQAAFQTAAGMGAILVMEPFASRVTEYLLSAPREELQPESMAAIVRLVVPRMIKEMGPINMVGLDVAGPYAERAANVLALFGPGIAPFIHPYLTGPAGAAFTHGFEAYALALAGARDAPTIKALQDVYADVKETDSVRCLAGAALGKLSELPAGEIAVVIRSLAKPDAEYDQQAWFAVSLLPVSAHPAILPAVQKLAAAEGSKGGGWTGMLAHLN